MTGSGRSFKYKTSLFTWKTSAFTLWKHIFFLSELCLLSTKYIKTSGREKISSEKVLNCNCIVWSKSIEPFMAVPLLVLTDLS